MVALAVAALSLGPVVLGAGVPAAAVACEPGTTRYIQQASPNLQGLAIPQSWRLATGSRVTVAVVDSGVDPGNAHLGKDVVLPGRSFVPGDPRPDGRTDIFGHGTAVAGIIAARPLPDLKSGMIGAAPDVKILPVRVFSLDSEDPQPGEYVPTGSRTAQGIRWAVDNGADVINVSISMPPANISLVEMKQALAYAYAKGVVVVASAGDASPEDPKRELRYPAAGDHVIGVAATNADGVVDDYSVHGEQVDVAAPGSNVLVTFRANGDCQTEPTPRTSWAAPFVSALAAQLRQRYPDAGPDEIAYRIFSTAARPVPGQRDDTTGWGLIQPYEALSATLDRRRPGPALPGTAAAPQRASVTTGARAMAEARDPLATDRRRALWWILAAGGLAALALVGRPLLLRVLRSR